MSPDRKPTGQQSRKIPWWRPLPLEPDAPILTDLRRKLGLPDRASGGS